MAPPSQLAIATSAVLRLVKEEKSYHTELKEQEARIKKLEEGPSNDENTIFQLKQERLGAEQTKAMFPSLRGKIGAAVAKLEEQLEAIGESENGNMEITKAKEAIAQSKAS